MAAVPASPRFLAVLGGVLAGFVLLSAIGCHYPQDWLLENLLVAATAVYLALTWRAVPLSRTSCVLILVFLGFHEIGAHTTFAEVPYDAWTRTWLGFSLNEALGWERNHYDRLVHLLYGLLIVVPMRETIDRRLGLRDGFASRFTAWIFILATSSAYEMIEWAAALVFGGDLGQAYLGTQGDIWDSHKDTALAVLGATLTLTASAFRRRQPASTA